MLTENNTNSKPEKLIRFNLARNGQLGIPSRVLKIEHLIDHI